MKSRLTFGLCIALLALMLIGALIMTQPVQPAAAAPGDALPVSVQTINTAGIATSTNWSSRLWSGGDDPHTNADLFYSIDQGSTPNTLTLKIQVSPDSVLWADYVTVLSANTTDVTGAYTTTTILGRYYRVTATVGNTQTVTPTIKVVLR